MKIGKSLFIVQTNNFLKKIKQKQKKICVFLFFRGRYVYVFGAGYHGQLGRKAARGHKKYANVPISVPLNEPIRQIACGALHTAVVTDDGKVYSWGDGRWGQLGHLQEGFSNQPLPTQVDALSGVTVVSIACGQNHTLAVTGIYLMLSMLHF